MRMTKRTAALVAFAAAAALCVACALCACAVGGAADDEEPDEAAPTITIGADVLEPFFYVGRDGEYQGIDADIAREACRRAGLKLQFVDVSWSERDARLADGTVDCIWSGFAINGREDSYAWTDSYLDTSLAMIVPNHSPSESLEDFRGPGGVAVRINSIAEQFFLNGASLSNPSAVSIHAYGSAEMAQAAFVKGFTDSWASYKLVLDNFMADYPGLYRYLDDNLVTLHLGVAFEKGYDGPYLSQLNDALDSMKRDGTIDAIVANHDGGAAAGEEVADAH